LDTIDFNSARQRERFTKCVLRRLPEVDPQALETDLLALPDTLSVAVQEPGPVADNQMVNVTLAFTPSTNGRPGALTAEQDGTIVHLDTVDPQNAKDRARFIKDLTGKVPDLNTRDAETQLLDIASQMLSQAQPKPAPACPPAEMEVTSFIRPEQFFLPTVAGFCVPVMTAAAGKPAANWELYLRSKDGTREKREMGPCIDLPQGAKAWIHPIPGEPSLATVCGWSAAARRAWLEGAPASQPAELFKRICERIAYFIDLPEHVAAGTIATLTLWSLLTYVYQAWDAVPYLYIGGPMGSGKSTLFSILWRLVFRPLLSSNVTAPALFRTLHDRGGVVLFDEAERLRQSTPETGEILSMLLAGYKRGGQATRLEKVGDEFRTVMFDVFGPKALACIAGLPPALASRCLSILMFRAGPDSPRPQRRIDEDSCGWQRLRDDLYTLALENGPVWLDLSRRPGVCPHGISGRSYELWQPLLALASWIESHGADGLLACVQRYALDSIDTAKDDAVPEADEILLELLTEEVRNDQWPTPGDLLEKAQQRDASIFGKPGGSGPRWHANTVSKRLKTYGIPIPRKSNGQRRYRDVTMTMLWRIQRHYGIDLEISESVIHPETPTLTDPTDPAIVNSKGP
jgi:hypothetical protein